MSQRAFSRPSREGSFSLFKTFAREITNASGIAFGGAPLFDGKCRFGGKLSNRGVFFAQNSCLVRFAIKRLCHRRGAAHHRKLFHEDRELLFTARDFQSIAGLDFTRRLDAVAVQTHAAEFDSFLRKRTCFEESGGPKPLVNTDGLQFGHKRVKRKKSAEKFSRNFAQWEKKLTR